MRDQRGECVPERPRRSSISGMLTVDQVSQYLRDGYLLIRELFAADELEIIRPAVDLALAERTERTIYEAGSTTVRSVYGMHQHGGVLSSLARHPRLVEASKQLLSGDVYVYQSKINTKAVFGGDVWPWHQDYVFWLNEDAMPEPRALTAAVFVDEINEINGPMSLIPGSHREGTVTYNTYRGQPPGYEGAPAWISNLTATLKYTIEKQTFIRLAAANGVETPKAPPGSVLFFDCNVAHASPMNLSPSDRRMAMFTYNRVDNAPSPVGLRRPEFLVSRDNRPVVVVGNDVFRRSGRSVT